MIATQLLTDLAKQGIRLEAHGDRLRYSPRSAVTTDLVERMKTHKAELLTMLRAEADDASVDLPGATAVWRAALDRLVGDPDFPPDLMEALQAADAIWAGEPETGYGDEHAEAIAPPSPKALAPETSTDPWPGAAADFALLLTPDDLPEKFMLRQSVEVTHPDRFLTWLKRNIPRGISGPYATGGTIQDDLVCLRKILTHPMKEALL